MSYRTTRAFATEGTSAAVLASRLKQKTYELAITSWNEKECLKEIARLSAELGTAREALEPFAVYAEAAFPEDESYRPHNEALSHHRGRNDWLHVRVLDFRNAARAFAKLSATKGV